MLKDILAGKSQASYVEYGYGQVEPNHLSAQRTAQIYAQLPAAADIDVLEQGQFVKYDYAAAKDNGVGEVNFTGIGEWMLVYNEIKLYRDHQVDAEFAMKKGDYTARVYSPTDGESNFNAQSRYYGGKDADGNPIEKVTAPADMYELHYNEDPFHIESKPNAKMMPTGTTMVPRVFKTNVGDIFTTNTINATTLAIGDLLYVGENGILTTTKAEESETFAGSGDMTWQVVKVYTMPDRQKAVKIMRVA